MTTHCINNQWLEGRGEALRSFSPINGKTVWKGRAASLQQVDLAVSAASAALPAWQNKTVEQRLTVLNRFTVLLQENLEELAQNIALEVGKPLWEARGEVKAMIGKLSVSEKPFHERTGAKEKTGPDGLRYVLRHKPHGVVAVFGPYNFPGHLPNGHIIPALMAGNRIVFKPSEQAPLVAQHMMSLWLKAGIPTGVINMIQGAVDTGKALSTHPGLDGLFFTGSSKTGKILNQAFAQTPGKILALEMGGNNPLVVGQVNNLNATIYNIIQSAFISSGQRCTCARRLFVQEGEVGDRLLQLLVRTTGKLKVGSPIAEPQPFMGPVVSKEVADTLLTSQAALLSSGAKSLLEMRNIGEAGNYLTPGILDVTALKQVPDEEYFGPLLQVHRYQQFTDAVKAANNTRFGLSAGLLSDVSSEYRYFQQHITAGIVNWNRPTTGASSEAPFGGIGDSGNHRASAYYAADYCAYPVASVESSKQELPETLSPGMRF